MTDLTKPLSEVPVGAHVVHEGEVWRTSFRGGGRVHLNNHSGQSVVSEHRFVLHLDGDAPRPLAECVGRDVWVDHHVAHVDMHEGEDGCHPRVTFPGDTWCPMGNATAWPIVPPQPAADQPQRWEVECADSRWSVTDGPNGPVLIYDAIDEPTARALADHLNATGWQPPAAEPERPTMTRLLVEQYGLSHDAAQSFQRTFVSGLADAIEWLESAVNAGIVEASSVLDALGVDR